MSTETSTLQPSRVPQNPAQPKTVEQNPARTPVALVLYFALGAAFGVGLTQSEVLSWFRIQEMFRFQSPRMYEIIASAIATAAASLALLRRLGISTMQGEPIHIPPKKLGRGTRYVVGGTLFGVGWAFTGACPGPLFALVGNGIPVMIAAIASALAGTWLYGALRPKLPH